MKPRRKMLFWVTFLFLVLAVPILTLAQNEDPAAIEINHVAPVEGEESMVVNVYFTAVDANGRPIREPNIDGDATITLLNTDPPRAFPAIISDPQSPIYISLVIDTSGSMRGAIDSVLNAAQSAIDSKPGNAFVSVIAFNETLTVVQDFTDDPVLVRDAILRVAIPSQDFGTCIYDSLFDTINQLDQQIQSAEERRAIILFTDGQDQLRRNDPAPCSTRHTLQSMLDRAIELNTPIHTIGLTVAGDTTVNVGELRNIAAETRAFSAIGTETELGELFQVIMDGLNSQLVAQANVLPPAGANSATLSVNSRNAVVAPGSFTFFSSRNYDLPPPPVRILITGPTYDSNANEYAFLFSVEGAESISRLQLQLEDSGGLLVFDDVLNNPGETENYLLSGTGLSADEEYVLKIQAENLDGFLVETENQEVVLSEKSFRHNPPEAAPVEFEIESVNPRYAEQELIISLSVDGDVASYSGFIIDEETGERVFNIPEEPFSDADITLDLPEPMREQEPGTERDYILTMYVYTADGQRFESEYDFSPQPPPPPGFGERVMEAFRNYPAIPISIVVIFLVVIGYFMLQSRRRKADEAPAYRPPVNEQTGVIDLGDVQRGLGAAGAQNWEEDDLDSFATPVVGHSATQTRVRLNVLRTPNPNQERQAVITRFPFRIGRQDCDFNIIGDGKISRAHVEFTENNGRIFIADLRSTNKTFVEGQELAPGQPRQITGSVKISLGLRTEIQVDV